MTSLEPGQERPLDRFGRSDLPTKRQSRWRLLIPGQKLRWGSGGLFLAAILLALLVLSIFFVPDLLVKQPAGLDQLTGNDRVQAAIALAQARNSVRTALVQALGGAIVLLTLVVGLGQLLVARQGQLVDRFTKTIEQLGKSAVDVRLGAIFALQQIAERPEYARPVAEILLAYLKTHAKNQIEGSGGTSPNDPAVSDPTIQAGDISRGRLEPDLQATLRILVADRLWADAMPGKRLDLSFIDVRYADLPNVDLARVVLLGAVLDGSNLTGARMMFADMRGVSLKDADLTGADLTGADLTDAIATGAKFNKATLRNADLVRANLSGTTTTLINADLSYTDLTDTDLSNAKLNAADLDHASLGGTKLNGAKLVGTKMQRIRGLTDKTSLPEADIVEVVMDDESKAAVTKMFPQLQGKL